MPYSGGRGKKEEKNLLQRPLREKKGRTASQGVRSIVCRGKRSTLWGSSCMSGEKRLFPPNKTEGVGEHCARGGRKTR